MDATIVKVGGSLALYPEKLRRLCAKLSEISNKHKLIVIPGGGEFADVVREVDKRFTLSHEVSHRMAILGMDQYGLLLADLLPQSCIVSKLEQVQVVLDSGKLPVFEPSQLLFYDDFLENSWDVTSDSIAVYTASKLHINNVILVTDVDGIFTDDPKRFPNAKLIDKISARELLSLNKRTSIDRFIPKLLSQFQISCFVVNGLYPERVEAVLNRQHAISTLIYC